MGLSHPMELRFCRQRLCGGTFVAIAAIAAVAAFAAGLPSVLTDGRARAQAALQTGHQAPPADLLKRIETRAATLKRHLDLLRAADQPTRVAAFAELLASNDPALTDIAIDAALTSPDAALQALGLRAGFRQVQALVAKLAPVAGPEADAVVKACGDAVQYRIEGFSYATGKFEAHGQDHAGVGQVNGTTVSITIDYGCSLTAKLQPDGSLAGLVSAPYKKGSLPIRASFR